MIYRNETDENFNIYACTYFLLCLVLGMITLLLHNSFLYVSIVIIIYIINAFLLYLLINKKYKVTKNSIKIIVGPFEKTIHIKDIKKCYITNKNKMSYSTSKRCLCLETSNNVYFISPKKKDELLLHVIKNKGE